MNTHVRDNLNFLASATSDTESGSRTFTNTGYLDLDALTGGAGSITAVSVSVATGTSAIVMFAAEAFVNTSGAQIFVSYRISNATTVAASDNWSGMFQPSAASGTGVTVGRTRRHTGLTVGTNDFEAQARVTAGTGTIQRIDLAVWPLP
jgi:hypothetical protein